MTERLPFQSVPLAIDFGTRFVKCGFLSDNQLQLIQNEDGLTSIPCYVSYTGQDIVVGERARGLLQSHPSNTIYDMKRLLGLTYNELILTEQHNRWSFNMFPSGDFFQIRLGDEDQAATALWYPEQACAEIFKHVKRLAEQYLHERVSEVVIAVPSICTESVRRAIMHAAELAELTVIRLVNETTASAVAYEFTQPINNDEIILVYDWGAGSLTMSICRVRETTVDVLATGGNMNLGGWEIDNRLLTYFIMQFHEVFGELMPSAYIPQLMPLCEHVKLTLSYCQRAELQARALHQGADFVQGITRRLFEEMCEDIFRLALAPLDQLLQDAGLRKSDIQQVLIVGGCTRIPKIQELLRDYFDGRPVNRSLSFDHAVVFGAAIQGASIHGIVDWIWADRLPFSLVTTTSSGAALTFIRRNTVYPGYALHGVGFIPTSDSYITVSVYEGDHASAIENHLLGTFLVYGIQDIPRLNADILLTFEVDANGILHCKPTDLSGTDPRPLEILTLKGGLRRSDIEAIVLTDPERLATSTNTRLSVEIPERYFSALNTLLNDSLLREKLTLDETFKLTEMQVALLHWFRTDAENKAVEDYEHIMLAIADAIKPIIIRIAHQTAGTAITWRPRETRAILSSLFELARPTEGTSRGNR